MKIHSITLLLILLPFTNWAQFSNTADELEFSNPAYHSDARVHGKGYQASSFNFNFAYMGFNSVYSTNYQGALRFQQSMGKWKFGFHTTQTGISWYNNTVIGLSLGRDFAINRDWSIRPAIGLNYDRMKFESPIIDFITDKYQLVDVDLGFQLRYKTWQLFSAVNSIYSSKWYIENGSTEPFYLTNTARLHIGLQKSFQIDSLQRIDAAVIFDNFQGIQYLNTSVSYLRNTNHFLLGYGYRQLNLGYGRQFAGAHQVMLSLNLNQPSKLSNTLRYGFQLNYKWQLMHKAASLKFRGTPAF
ncbi:MAG: hypothetical protein RL440_837 [Bacteroidota bacterium]|jgi:hypothetical protein